MFSHRTIFCVRNIAKKLFRTSGATHRYSGGGPGTTQKAAKPPPVVAAQGQLGWEQRISRRSNATKIAKGFAGTGSRYAPLFWWGAGGISKLHPQSPENALSLVAAQRQLGSGVRRSNEKAVTKLAKRFAGTGNRTGRYSNPCERSHGRRGTNIENLFWQKCAKFRDLAGKTKSERIGSRRRKLWVMFANVTDRQTDGRTDGRTDAAVFCGAVN